MTHRTWFTHLVRHQKMEKVYSYNPKAHAGQLMEESANYAQTITCCEQKLAVVEA